MALVALFTSCKGQQTATSAGSPPGVSAFGSASDTIFFSLERTPCFGKCEAYTVTINADGSAKYIGRSNAPRQGTFTGNVDKATMQSLLDRAHQIGFFDLEDKYDGNVTDLPSTIIRMNANGRDKKVVGRYKMPAAFKPFGAFADSVLAPVQWVKVAGEEQH